VFISFLFICRPISQFNFSQAAYQSFLQHHLMMMMMMTMMMRIMRLSIALSYSYHATATCNTMNSSLNVHLDLFRKKMQNLNGCTFGNAANVETY